MSLATVTALSVNRTPGGMRGVHAYDQLNVSYKTFTGIEAVTEVDFSTFKLLSVGDPITIEYSHRLFGGKYVSALNPIMDMQLVSYTVVSKRIAPAYDGPGSSFRDRYTKTLTLRHPNGVVTETEVSEKLYNSVDTGDVVELKTDHRKNGILYIV